MSDNVVSNPGVGGSTFATDEISTVHHPRFKVEWGVDGVAVDTSATNPMPVQERVSDGTAYTFGAGAVAGGTQRVTHASDDPVTTAVQLIDDAVATLGTSTYTETTTKGLVIGAVRRDANTTLVNTTNEVAPLQVDATGNLKVAIISGAGSGGTSIADEAAFTLASTSVTPIAALYNSTPDTLTTGKAGVVQMTADRKLFVAMHDGDGNLITSSAGALDVNIAGDTTLASIGLMASATFTPAAASHVANDCNGAAGTFALAAVSGSVVMISDVSLEIDGGTAEATAWRLHLYNVTPPSATADDGAWDLASGDRTAYLGYVDIGTAADMGSTQWIKTSGINMSVKLSGQSVFGYLVNLSTSTPAAVAHIVKVFAVQL